MIKLFVKRMIALWIDCFIIGVLCILIFFSIFGYTNIGIIASLLSASTLFLLKDCMFCNASLGKKLFGLVVLDKNGKVPGCLFLVKRNLLMIIFGLIMYIYCSLLPKQTFEEWEMKFLGAGVFKK